MGKHTAAAGTEVAVTTDRTIYSWLTPQRRKWVYGVVAAALAVAGAYGLLDDNLVALWDILAAAILRVATQHTGGTYVAPVEPPVTEVPADEVPGTEEVDGS